MDEYFAQFEYKPRSGSSPRLRHASTPSMTPLRPRGSFPLQGRKKNERKKTTTKKKNDIGKGKNVIGKGKNVIGKGKRSKATILTAAQRRSEPYRRVDLDSDRRWTAPASPHRLIQEPHAYDPWKVLVICMLCNRTRGSHADTVIPKLFSLCPSAEKTLQVDVCQIEKAIEKLGLQRKRSESIKRLSDEYLQDWEYVTQLHSVGKYAADAYAIFCSGYWRDVTPVDHKLVEYWKYLHENENQV